MLQHLYNTLEAQRLVIHFRRDALEANETVLLFRCHFYSSSPVLSIEVAENQFWYPDDIRDRQGWIGFLEEGILTSSLQIS